MERGKQRNSSLELLRIICMVMIILHHYAVHGGYAPFTLDTLNGNVVVVQMLAMFGRAACSIFAIISGYFLVSSQNKGYKKSLSLLTEMMFYSLLILFLLMITGIIPLTYKSIIKLIFPIFWDNWYIKYYLIFLFFVPFLNPFLRSLDKKIFLRLLFILIIIWSVIPTFTKSAWSFSEIDFFIVMYLVGGYIRLHADNLTYPNKRNLWIALISGALMLISVPAMDLIGIVTGINKFVSSATYFKEYSTPLSVAFAVGMFLYFKNLQFYSPVINRIATSVVGIYLIHDGIAAREVIWKVFSPNVDFINSPWLLLHVILKCSVVFVGGLIIDQIRLLTIDKLFQKWLDRKYPIWQCKWKQIEEKFNVFIGKD